ncbi:MAG: hypothetical protein ABW022_08425 [Actinoplanes sp.]
MTWFRVDDGLHSHRKAVRAGVPAMGLWVLAGSWCADHLTDGFIPDYMAARIDRESESNAARLVEAGLWMVAEKGGDKGWQFHEWTDQQPTREEAMAAVAKKSSGGKLGNHRRWHLGDGRADPKCPFCHDAPAKASAESPDSDRISDRSTDQTSDRSQESVANPPYRTDPYRPVPSEVQSPADSAAPAAQTALDGMPEPPEREFTPKDKAFGVARWRIDERAKVNAPIIGGGKKGPLHTLANVLIEAFEAGYTEEEVRQALINLEDGIPSKQAVNREVVRVRARNSGTAGNSVVPVNTPHVGGSSTYSAPAPRRSTSAMRAEQALGIADELDRELGHGRYAQEGQR